MSAPTTTQAPLYRDGTSQAGRALAALDPESALVDDRTTTDWLRFLWAYARQLDYYDPENEKAGDWSGMFPFAEDRLVEQLEEVARFRAHPDVCTGPQFDAYRRPHFVLLLAFLDMLDPVRDRVNQFTRRHLDFYIREVLGFAPQPGLSGRVHLLIEPAAGQTPFLLPAGTLLQGGQDESGREVHYRTDTDQALIVNRARVAQCRSVYLERKITGLNDIRLDPRRFLEIAASKPPWWDGSLNNRTRLALLQISLGEPNPGDPLPKYAGREIDDTLLAELDKLLGYIPDNLYLTLPAFRDLMVLRRRLKVTQSRDKKNQTEADGRWDKVNQILEKAGQEKRGQSNYTLAWQNRDDFDTNLKEALHPSFGGLEEVDDIYGLDRRVDPEQPESQYAQFVVNDLCFVKAADRQNASKVKEGLAQFKDMMAIVNAFYEDWRRAADILRGAGRRKERNSGNSGFKVTPINLRQFDTQRWEKLLAATLGPLPPFLRVGGRTLASLDDLDAELDRLEQTFHLRVEEFDRLRKIISPPPPLPPSKQWEWNNAFDLLTQARLRLELARRGQKLKDLRQGKTSVRDRLEAMVLGALADPKKPAQLPEGKKFFGEGRLDPKGDVTYIEKTLFLTAAEVQFVQDRDTATEPKDEDWDKIALILDQAQRKRDSWSPPPLEFESWQNLYAATDATQVRASGTGSDDAASPRWRTFGDGLRADAATVPATLGFMVASPLLALSAGDRVITLTLRFARAGFDAAVIAKTLSQPPEQFPFGFRLSTAKGWLEIPVAPKDVVLLDPPGLKCVLRLDAQAPPIAPLSPENPAGSAGPVLQVLLSDLKAPEHSDDPTWPTVKPYEVFRTVAVESLQLEVEVGGLMDLRLQNDDGLLDPKKPFEPFGFAPVTGSRFVFVHPEICAKRLAKLRVEMTWMGLPANLENYYAGYSVKPTGAAALNFSDRRLAKRVKNVDLFKGATGTTTPAVLEVTSAELAAAYTSGTFETPEDPNAEPLSWKRHWELELGTPDFQHSVYPAEAARAASSKAADGSNQTPKVLLPPYTPRIKQMRIGYSASVELRPAAGGAGAADRFHHLEPFGFRPAAVRPEGGWYLLPQCDNEGTLYLGLAEANPPQSLAILFQMADGSADPDLPSQTVNWSYLSGNEWRPLDDRHRLSDTTRGLLNTGIIRFDLPAAEPGTLLPAGFYWIQASVARHSRAIGDMVAIHTQAVSACRVLPEANSSDAGYMLAPHQITGLVVPRPEVKAVHQPYSSFGGRTPEAEPHFATRVSERLRHKDRALTCWDYERLVLEAFPEIYKAKCLPVDATDDPALASVVQVIVVPDIRGKRPFDPFEPKVSADVLQNITEFLTARKPANARLSVRNPRYCRLTLRFSVRFRPGCDPAFYTPRLNDAVCRYLSPWAYDGSGDIVFGGRVNASLIIYFVEQQPCVDHVADLRLFLTPADGTSATASSDELDLSKIDWGAPDLIVVSATEHDIDLIVEDHYEPESFIGINYMKIELDFRLA